MPPFAKQWGYKKKDIEKFKIMKETNMPREYHTKY